MFGKSGSDNDRQSESQQGCSLSLSLSLFDQDQDQEEGRGRREDGRGDWKLLKMGDGGEVLRGESLTSGDKRHWIGARNGLISGKSPV